MSAPCDPLFEVCEEEQPTEAVVEEEVAAEEEDKGSLRDLIYEASFGIACLYGVYSGFSLDWLTSEIEGDARYPARVAGTDAFDQDWAVETKEVTAWKDAGSFMLQSYAVATLLWGANFFIGNNGSTLHRVFYRFTQAFQLVPFLNLIKIYQIKSSYLINDWFSYYDALGVDNGGTVDRAEYVWLYNPNEDDETNEHYYDPTEHNSKLWTAVWGQMFIALCAMYAQPTMKLNWEAGLEEAANAEDEEKTDAPEEVAAE